MGVNTTAVILKYKNKNLIGSLKLENFLTMRFDDAIYNSFWDGGFNKPEYIKYYSKEYNLSEDNFSKLNFSKYWCEDLVIENEDKTEDRFAKVSMNNLAKPKELINIIAQVARVELNNYVNKHNEEKLQFDKSDSKNNVFNLTPTIFNFKSIFADFRSRLNELQSYSEKNRHLDKSTIVIAFLNQLIGCLVAIDNENICDEVQIIFYES